MFFSEINVFFPFIVAFHFSTEPHPFSTTSNLYTRELVYLSTPKQATCPLVNLFTRQLFLTFAP